MEDIIDIIVTETTNTIEITAQPNDEIIDVNIIDNREDIVLNVTPTVVEININSLTSNFGVSWGQITGTLSNQTDLNNALALKANLVGGKVPASELPSYVDDVVEVANFAALPATGETGKIYITLDNNKIYRWSGSTYIEIADSTAVWGAITGTLSSQTDLQNALNAKFDDPTGDTTQYIAGDGSLITFPIAGQAGTLVREVRNTTGATLTKGTIVYISGATGNKPTVSKAIATGDATSAQTFGMCQANIANNSNGYVVCVGDLTGLDTSAFTEGNQLYLSSTTAGTYTTTKQLAPNHLVYIGVVTRAHPTQGQIEVNIQNGYELYELHDVSITSEANNQGLFYESSTDLWKNKSIATVLGYTPQAQLNGTGFVKASGTTISYDNSTYLTTSAAASTYLALAGGTLTGALNGTSATFTGDLTISSANPRLYFTDSDNNPDYFISNTDGTFTVYDVTNSTSRFTIGTTGNGTFGGNLTVGQIIRSGGTSSQFLKADGSVDSTAYLPLGGGTLTGNLNAQTIDLNNSTASNALRITHTNGSYHAVSIIATGNSALYASGSVTVIGTIQATSTIIAQAGLSNGAGQSFTLPSSTGTLALTSQLASYLPLSGGTLTGALSGTSATFSGKIRWGAGSYEAGVSGLYNVSDDGTVLTTKTGTVRDFLLANGNGATVMTIPTGTQNATFSSSVTANAYTISSGGSDSVLSFLNNASGGARSISYGVSTAAININNTGGSPLVTFLNGGNVGIGTTSPSQKLHVTGSGDVVSLVETAAGSFAQYRLLSGSGGTPWVFGTQSDYLSGSLVFRNSSDRMVITTGGNVGIGTTAPSSFSGYNGITTDGTTGGFYDLFSSGARKGTFNTTASLVSIGSTSTQDFALLTNNTERMRITSGGNVLIGTTTDAGIGKLQVNGTVNIVSAGGLAIGSVGGRRRIQHDDGLSEMSVLGNNDGYYPIGASAFNTRSDYRLKEDLKEFNGLSLISNIKVYDFKWKEKQERNYGFMAHELQEVLPYVVTGKKDGMFQNKPQMQGVDYSKIVPVMVQAIKDLKTELDTLKNK